MADDEPERAARLLEAQDKAVRLFTEIERRGLVAAGEGERAVSDRIRDLANEMFGPERTTRYRHKRIVRSGPNTVLPCHRRLPRGTAHPLTAPPPGSPEYGQRRTGGGPGRLTPGTR
ncbi:hypothetical protein GCM10011578_064490 [Streptomyces fuscichromogenes]|uniref:Uncharacterized protein n=1 Tax=Streptomyces fuscichromogenes TaxID=1324013 RepID=A0A918CUI8_9ACTN|nr:hypothetical protein GCM10011578_064490 [Streptomyces fuscichromogenes]